MKKLVVLSGVPGSGKSYFSNTIKEIKGYHVYLISSDLIRKEMLGNQRNLSKEQTVWDIFYNLPKIYAYDEDAFVILDATHILASLRKRVYNDLHKYFDEVYLVSFALNKEQVTKQNKEREFPVPDYVLESFINEFELPDEEEYTLFNKIYIINDNEIEKVINEII